MTDLLNTFAPITLEEMSGVKLMNRTDTKFVTTVERLCRLLTLARDDYRAQEIDGKRIAAYYTAYFDTPDFNMYVVHQNGHVGRQKLRIRSYVDSGLNFLEVKTKNNHGRTKKKRITVPSQELPEVLEAGGTPFIQGLTGQTFDDIMPTVQNHFQRITLVNYGKTERLTIDFNVRFHNFETETDAQTGDLVIIELKRDGNVYSPVLELLRQIRVKPHGFSKYCIGSAMTNGHLKNNNFKFKMITISKLTGHHFSVPKV